MPITSENEDIINEIKRESLKAVKKIHEKHNDRRESLKSEKGKDEEINKELDKGKDKGKGIEI